VLAPKVTVVEDDEELRAVLVRGLGEEGFAPKGVATGGELLASLAAGAPDVLVVDVGLPDADGRDLCQAIRAQGVSTPILFLSARDTLNDRITGLNAGGDDYLTKPFAFGELVARLHALLRRSAVDRVVEAGVLRLDPAAHAAVVAGRSIALTPTEFRLLAYLAANAGAAVRRRDLVNSGWPYGARVRDNTLDAYVARLRRKLQAASAAPRITTVHGVGYRLE